MCLTGGGLRDFMHFLLWYPKKIIALEEHTPRLMRAVLSAEVVPFGSQINME